MIRTSKDERIKFNADYPADTDFSAFARLLQSKWRDKKGYPQGKLGNYLERSFAETTKSNFLTVNIRNLVTVEIENIRKNGGLISTPRIWDNMLSSQPLCFNLFGELCLDLNLATNVFKKLFPDKIEKVNEIKFEFSPGRGDSKYIGDHSAFDVFIKYSRGNISGFIGMEVKYAESLREETVDKANKNFKERYENLTIDCGIFLADSIKYLRKPPLSQIWRDHLLAIATKQDYDEGFFVFLFPSKNAQYQNAIDDYSKYLFSKNFETNCFYPMNLEKIIEAISAKTSAEWINELKERYLGEY